MSAEEKKHTFNPAAAPSDVQLAYGELCHSYNAIREFRARLLSLLPLASAGGVFLLLRNGRSAVGPFTLLVFGVLGCLITLGLFIYEWHNMKRCHRLIQIGARWEEKRFKLKDGQFMMRLKNKEEGTVAGSSYLLAAGLIYGAVFLGWLYLAVVGWLWISGSGPGWLGLV
ncbi:MAG: hypothetical protein IPM53_28640 [Anaerolineaceae bacterium]|nr:hypothetical protein [Anaerolineaceae bacterium]